MNCSGNYPFPISLSHLFLDSPPPPSPILLSRTTTFFFFFFFLLFIYLFFFLTPHSTAPPEASRKSIPKLRLQDENSPPVSSRGNLVKAIPISGTGLASSPLTSHWGSSSPSEGGSQTTRRIPSLDNTSTAFALLTMNSPAMKRPVSERGTARGGMDSPFTQRNGQKKEKKKREMGNFTPAMGNLVFEEEDDDELTATESDENEMEDVEDTEANLRRVEERMKYHDLLHDEQGFSERSPPQPLPSRSPIELFLQSPDTEDEMEEVVDRECLRKRVLNPAASASQPILPSADSNLALPRRAGSTGGFRSPSPNSAPAVKQTRRHSKQYSSYTAEKRADWPEPAREGGEKRGSTSSTQHCPRRVKRKQSGEDKRPPASLSSSSSGGGLLSRSTSSFDMFFMNSPGSGGEEGLTGSPSFSSTTPLPVPSSSLTTTPFSPTVSPTFAAFPLNFSSGSSDPSQRRRKGSLSKKMSAQERSLFDDVEFRGTASGELPRRAEGPGGVHPSRRKKVVGGGALGSEHSGPLMSRRGSVSGLNLNYDRSASFETKKGFLNSRLSSSSLSTSPLPSSPSFTSSPSPFDPPIDLHKTHRSLNVDSSENPLNSPVAPNLPRRRGSLQKRGLMTRGQSHTGLPIPDKGFGGCLSPSVEPRNSSFVRTESTSRNLFRGFGDEKGEKRKREHEEGSTFIRSRTLSFSGIPKGLEGENRPYLCRSCTSMREDEMSLNDSSPGLLSSLPASNPPATEEKGALSKSLATALTCSNCGAYAGEESKQKKRTKTSENSTVQNSLTVSQENGSFTERPGRRANSHFFGRPQNPFGLREEPLLEGKLLSFDNAGMTTITGETVREIFRV